MKTQSRKQRNEDGVYNGGYYPVLAIIAFILLVLIFLAVAGVINFH